jgi:heterodisulfide reductase subunit C
MAMSGQTLLLLISLIQYVRFGDSEFLGHQKGRLCISTMNKLWLCMYCYLCAH